MYLWGTHFVLNTLNETPLYLLSQNGLIVFNHVDFPLCRSGI